MSAFRTFGGRYSSRQIAALLSLAAVGGIAATARASTYAYNWTGAGSGNNWNTQANWSGGNGFTGGGQFNVGSGDTINLSLQSTAGKTSTIDSTTNVVPYATNIDGIYLGDTNTLNITGTSALPNGTLQFGNVNSYSWGGATAANAATWNQSGGIALMTVGGLTLNGYSTLDVSGGQLTFDKLLSSNTAANNSFGVSGNGTLITGRYFLISTNTTLDLNGSTGTMISKNIATGGNSGNGVFQMASAAGATTGGGILEFDADSNGFTTLQLQTESSIQTSYGFILSGTLDVNLGALSVTPNGATTNYTLVSDVLQPGAAGGNTVVSGTGTFGTVNYNYGGNANIASASISYGANDQVILSVIAAPEPSSLGILACGAFALLRRGRRRRESAA